MIDTAKFKPKTVYVIYIASTAEQVWQALTSSEFTRKYFWQRDVELEPKPGGAFALRKLPACLVTYELAQAGEAVRLTMTESHSWDVPDAILSGGRSGWPAILSSLKSLLEGGRPLAIAMEPPKEMIEAIKGLR